MSILTIRKKGRKVLATGNEAIARGALEAGIGFASTYPGTPASGIGDSFFEVLNELEGFHFEYSMNEKVAFEGAIGAAWCGIRAICSMKLPGINVIADTLHPICYFGVKGLVIVNGGDPGLQSSSTEQDNRWYALHAHFPVIEPSTVQEAKDFTRIAFEVSEKFGVPCMINIANNLCYGTELLELGELPERFPMRKKFQGPLVKGTVRSVGLHKMLLEKEAAIAECFAESQLNKVISGQSRWGIISSGLPYGYVMEALDMLGFLNVPVLKLGLVYPLSSRLLRRFAQGLEKLIIVEELEPFLESQIKNISWDLGLKLSIMGKEIFPSWGALSPTSVTLALSKHLGVPLPAELQEVEDRRQMGKMPSIAPPARNPTMCAGCPHRGTAYAVRSATHGKVIIGSEIGCYSLLRGDPWNLTDWSVCMGSGIGIAQGMSHKLEAGPLVSFIGDSSFFHAGLEPVLNAVYYDSNVLLLILDNRWTAMTGHQPCPSTVETINGQRMNPIPIKKVLEGLGVKQIRVANPFRPDEMIQTVTEALSQPGFRVIIAEGECMLQIKRRLSRSEESAKAYSIDQQLCAQCGECYSGFMCPAIIKRSEEAADVYYIDSGLCAGCGACATICPCGAIIESKSR